MDSSKSPQDETYENWKLNGSHYFTPKKYYKMVDNRWMLNIFYILQHSSVNLTQNVKQLHVTRHPRVGPTSHESTMNLSSAQVSTEEYYAYMCTIVL